MARYRRPRTGRPPRPLYKRVGQLNGGFTRHARTIFARDEQLEVDEAPSAIVAVIVAWLSLGLAPQGVAEVAKIFNQQDAMTEFDTLVPGRFQAMKDGSRVTYTEGLSDDRGQLAGVFISEKRMQRQVEGEKPKQSGITVLVALILWYVLAFALNASGVIDRVLTPRGPWTSTDLIGASLNATRPLLPAPHQLAIDIWNSITQWPLTSPRNLLLHTWVTASAALTDFPAHGRTIGGSASPPHATSALALGIGRDV